MFSRAYTTFNQGSDLRRRRRICKKFTYGRQWDYNVYDQYGRVVSEDVDLMNRGYQPLTNNLIRRLVRNIVGRYRSMIQDDPTLAAIYREPAARDNYLDELDSRLIEEFLISGCVIQRVVPDEGVGASGVSVENVSPESFFVNPFRDPRGRDVETVGMLHALTLPDLLSRFAGADIERARHLRDIYTSDGDIPQRAETRAFDLADHESFYRARDGRCRVIELWTLDADEQIVCHDRSDGRAYVAPAATQGDIDAENARRRRSGSDTITTAWGLARHWHYRFFAPNGELLAEGRSPLPDGGHPFLFKFYPLTDGEVYPFVEDLIDQQRYINRLITSIDHIMRVSAKGVLLFPMDQLAPNFSWEQLVRAWTSSDGVIPLATSNGAVPRQVVTNISDAGAYKLLDLEMKLFQDTSGVSDALLGKDLGGNAGVELYQERLRNATITLLDIFASFRSFVESRSRKIANFGKATSRV